jgi:ABC-type amino acid transport substrate-binding protein
MFRRILAATSLALAIAAFGTTASADDFKSGLTKPNTIVVGTTGSAPPATMIDDSGKLAGFDIDVMNRIGKDLGVKVEFVQLDWAGLLPGLAAGRFDTVASGVTRTKERLASKDFILLSPYIINGVAVTKLASNHSINSWSDVCGKRMGTIRGAIESKLILATVPNGCITDIVEYPGWTEMALDLKNGRIDWIGQDYLGPLYAAKQDPALAVLPDMRSPKTQGIAVSAKEPQLAKAMDALIVKYRGDGTLDQLIKKWFGQTVDWSKMPAD